MPLLHLHQMIVNQDIDAFKNALANHADPNQLDPIMGNVPLHIAAYNGYTPLHDAV